MINYWTDLAFDVGWVTDILGIEIVSFMIDSICALFVAN